MDIQVSSNFERLLYEILQRDMNKLNIFMNRLKDNYYELDQDYR